ncbi:Serine/threonine protein kinase [Trema orientale]|uniref:Serine/threonine protein kinase n=1 Tax=Trema orientale TaxID=63057 RepID=A0A2P5CF43_TREOI|nr:Serine/threonine protein kinase [Trema orientale]
MELSILIHRIPIWVFLILTKITLTRGDSVPRTSLASQTCSPSEYDPTSNFAPNLYDIMKNVTDSVSTRQWGSSNKTWPPPEVYAFAQCHGDLPEDECSTCFAAFKTKLRRCQQAVSARFFLDGCFLRYDNHSFYHEAVDDRYDRVTCGPTDDFAADDIMRVEFEKKVRSVIGNLSMRAVENGGFAVDVSKGGVEGVFGLAQCWRTLRVDDCRKCLSVAAVKLGDCAPASDGRAMFTGCYLRYSTEKFFHTDLHDDAESNRAWIIVLGIFAAFVLTLLAICGLYLGVYWGYRSKEKRVLQDDISITIQNSSLNFKYEILEKATEFFDISRKLGQGGAGSVFKGILPNGKTVAVKRLFFNTRQWVGEFFNEVNLISGIEHKNLVKLLGCSIEGPESLLVYEFVPNKSLDQLLFDKKNTSTILNWQQRFNIISGTAEGLAFLHGGCGSKIIHRDIKTSNILLADNLIPKIADFGLARSVSGDRTHLSTGIAGTLGYMAPEYLVRGQLTEKADVYAFGVLVLEIVCGRKNSAFALGSNSILHSVWKCYKEKDATKYVDPALKGIFPIEEASNVIQIGLLCTQASAALRPSMSEVVKMLNDKQYEIPSPKQPPFLNASLLNSDEGQTDGQNPDEVSSSYTANSSTSNESICEATAASEPL